MNGFKPDYARLLQLFQERSRITCESTAAITESISDVQTSGETAVASTSGESQNQITDNQYVKVYTFSFGQFIECFEQLKFASVLCGHRNNNSLRELFDQIAEYLIARTAPNEPIEVRIFSFYLLYTLWFIVKKSYELSVKIRLYQTAYLDLNDFVQYSSKQQQFDVVLAYRKLLLAGAFAFCENQQQWGPYYKDYLSKNDTKKDNSSAKPKESSISLAKFKKNKTEYISELSHIDENKNKFDCELLLSLLNTLEENCEF